MSLITHPDGVGRDWARIPAIIALGLFLGWLMTMGLEWTWPL